MVVFGAALTDMPPPNCTIQALERVHISAICCAPAAKSAWPPRLDVCMPLVCPPNCRSCGAAAATTVSHCPLTADAATSCSVPRRRSTCCGSVLTSRRRHSGCCGYQALLFGYADLPATVAPSSASKKKLASHLWKGSHQKHTTVAYQVSPARGCMHCSPPNGRAMISATQLASGQGNGHHGFKSCATRLKSATKTAIRIPSGYPRAPLNSHSTGEPPFQ
jgi:hypothetical protein